MSGRSLTLGVIITRNTAASAIVARNGAPVAEGCIPLRAEGKDNDVYCCHCHTIVISYTRYDFKTCRCSNEQYQVCVDGGREYQKRCFGTHSKWIESDGTICPEIAAEEIVPALVIEGGQ